MNRRRVLFSGYAKVHFVCFLPVYEQLRDDPDIELFLSGGFKSVEGEDVTFSVEGFYDEFPVDHSRILDAEATRQQDFDVLVCAHLSDVLFPRAANRTVQIFHGVSFKNLAVREKALRYDYLCLPGRYHAEQYVKQGLIRANSATGLITGFPKVDALGQPFSDRSGLLRGLGLDPDRPTLLLAPTGDKYNALELMGREVIQAIAAQGAWNLLVKPHDHPKNDIDWFSELADLEGEGVRLVRDKNVVPYLHSADVLLTDASSVALEYTLLDRPILFLDTPKLIKRLKKKAPALDLDTYGRKLGRIVAGPEDVVNQISDCLASPGRESALRRQAAEHLFHLPGEAAKRVAGVIRHAAGLEAALPDDVESVPTD
jgi:CDP-glycerol glycerophosphotransferase (TagB/SpsB family)